jgi:hypothetical protein
MRFSFNSNSTLSNRRPNHSSKLSSTLILTHKHLNYFPIMNWPLVYKQLLMILSAAVSPSNFIVMMGSTKLILLMIRIYIARLIYIRIPKSKSNAEVQIKLRDFIKLIIFIISVVPLVYMA